MPARRLALLFVLTSFLVSTPGLVAHDGLREQIAALTIRIASEPANANLYVRRGDLYRASGKLGDARTDLARAGALDSSVAGLHLAFSLLERDARRPRAAAAAATRHLAADPSSVEALLLRARAYVELRRTADAVADLSLAVARNPLPDVFIERARLLEADPADLQEALNGIEEGLRRLGPVVTLELEAIDIERRLHRYDAAIDRVDAITARSTRREPWLARRGALLEEAGRASAALASYEAALAAANALAPHIRATRAAAALAANITAHIDSLTAAVGRRRIGRSRSQ